MKTFGLATVLALLLAAPAVAATDENVSIETLLKDGWQIAGYAAANQFAVESAMILLRHANQSYLVQCRASFDLTPQSKRQHALLQAALSGHSNAAHLSRIVLDEAVKRRPGRIVTLRQKTRLLADS